MSFFLLFIYNKNEVFIMFIENLFGNVFGLVWLIIFLVAVVALIFWIILKKEKENIVIENVDEKLEIEEKEEVKEEIKTIWPKAVVKQETIEQTKEKKVPDNEYEIVESEDGFFRVKKVGNERTLRKFSTRVEAENYIEKRGL